MKKTSFTLSISLVLINCVALVAYAQKPEPTEKCELQARKAAAQTPRASEVEALLERLKARLTKVYPTSGFANPAEFKKAIQNSPPEYKRAAAILAAEDVELIAVAPPSARKGILLLSKGLRNSHAHGKSMGALLVDKDAIEAAYVREDLETYSKMSPTSKPIYSFLGPKPNSGLKRARGVYTYGPDRWIIKMKNVRDRLTFCVGDSLNHLSVSFMGDPWILQHQDWDTHLVPWSMRELLVPAVGQALNLGYLGLPVKPFLISAREVDQNPQALALKPKPLDRILAPDKPVEFSPNWNRLDPITGPLQNFNYVQGWDMDYIEMQIWDVVTLEDIEAFEFSTSPPTGEELQALIAHKIPIRDARVWPPRPWTPPPPRVVRNLSLAQLMQPDSRGIDIIDFLSKDPEVKSLMEGPTQTWEGYTVEEHTVMVFERFLEEIKHYKFPAPENIRLLQTLKFAIALHDIGKPRSQYEQHKHTIPILKRELQRHGFNAAEIRLAVALVGHDIFGEYLTGLFTEEDTEARLHQNAAIAGLKLEDYLRLQFFFFTIDASSYPAIREDVFVREPDGRLLPHRGYNQKLYGLLKKMSVEI